MRTRNFLLLVLGALAACTGGHDPNPSIAASECEQCHLSQHDTVVNPPHKDVIPFKCVACHVSTDWVPRDNSGHDFLFRVFSGSHDGIACVQCHLEPAGFFEFSCVDCHTHSASATNSKHGGVGGYAYESPLCLRCHMDRVQ